MTALPQYAALARQWYAERRYFAYQAVRLAVRARYGVEGLVRLDEMVNRRG